jgi:hypothetical protein
VKQQQLLRHLLVELGDQWKSVSVSAAMKRISIVRGALQGSFESSDS